MSAFNNKSDVAFLSTFQDRWSCEFDRYPARRVLYQRGRRFLCGPRLRCEQVH